MANRKGRRDSPKRSDRFSGDNKRSAENSSSSDKKPFFKRSQRNDSSSSRGKYLERHSREGDNTGGAPKRTSGNPKRPGQWGGPVASRKGREQPRSTKDQYDKSFSEKRSGHNKRSAENSSSSDKKPFFKRSQRKDSSSPRGRYLEKHSSEGDSTGRAPHRTSGNPKRSGQSGRPIASRRGREQPRSRKDHDERSFSEKRSFRAGPAKTPRREPRTGKESRRSKHDEQPSPQAKPNQTRLNKYIANSGVASRRNADELIKMGLISINGKVVTELGYKVKPGDEVRYEDKVLRAEKPVYILMNKPKGFLTTTDDPQERKTVMHIVGSAVRERIYPVGRLDRNTTGLLLLTNDGDLADKLMHPSFDVKKIYKVELNRPLTKADFETILSGVRLEEGVARIDDLAIVSDDGKTVGLEIHIGWNRIVRRIFESLGYEVVKLDRTMYAGLDKKDLSRGQWRFLTKQEIVHLKHFK